MREVSKLLSSVLMACSVLGASPEKGSLQVRESKSELMLSAPWGGLTMILPKGGVSEGKDERGGSAKNRGYFAFEDQKMGIVVSGWFEPQERFSGAKIVWETETKQWIRQGLPAPTGVSFQKMEQWEAVVYDMPITIGNSTHIRAHWVQAGTWIDIHLSLTSTRPIAECRERLLALLKSIRVKATP